MSDNFGNYSNLNDLMSAISNKFKAKVGWADASRSVKKNLLNNTAITHTNKNVTYTVNADKSMTLTGTSSGNYGQVLGIINLKAGTYTVSGIPNNIVGGLSSLQLNVTSNGQSLDWRDRGNDKSKDTYTFANDTTVEVNLSVYNGYNTNGLTIYPMIRLASIKDDTYVPYILDNVELKEQIDTKDEGIEVTQAQYDALPSSKNTDGKNYYIKDSTPVAVILNDNTVGADRVWSSQKTKAYVDGLITDALSASY